MRMKSDSLKGDSFFIATLFRGCVCTLVLLLMVACGKGGNDKEEVGNSEAGQRPAIAKTLKLIKEKDYEKANIVVFDLVARDPNDVEALAVLALLYSKQDRIADAMDFAEKALVIDPYFSLAHVVIGRVKYQTSHFEEALEKARKALIIDPDSILAYQLIGEVYLRKGLFKDALLVFQEAINRESDNPESLNLMGSAYIKAKKYEQALPHLLASLEIDPELPGTHLNLGLVYNQLNQPHKAMKHMDLAEALYLEEENHPWVAKTRDIKRVLTKKFKLRPEDVIH